MDLIGFASWAEVLAFARTAAPLYYQAPLDRHACRFDDGIGAWTYTVKGERIRMRPHRCFADPFLADAEHLHRFKHRPPKAAP